MIRTRARAFLLGMVVSLCLAAIAAVALIEVDPDWSGGWELDVDDLATAA